MSIIATSFIVENDKNFRRALDRLAATTSNFKIPFGIIATDWYRSNRKIFTLRSRGLYQDLAPASGQGDAGGITTTSNYKKQKLKDVGFIYPILFRTGALAKSILGRTNSGAVFSLGRQELVMGTSISYAKFHQSDDPRSKIPQRKFIFIDGGPRETAKDAKIQGRSERWGNIINDHILGVLKKQGFNVVL